MPKKANKEQLLDWRERLDKNLLKMEIIENLIAEADEENEVIKSEMKNYGMLIEDIKDED